MATKLDRMRRTLNDEFRDHLAAAMREKFAVEVETYFDLLGSMRMVTTRADGEPFTPEQHAWLGAWSEGYGCAMEQVHD